MKTLGNILWLVFGGLVLSLLWGIAGAIIECNLDNYFWLGAIGCFLFDRPPMVYYNCWYPFWNSILKICKNCINALWYTNSCVISLTPGILFEIRLQKTNTKEVNT